MRRLTVFAMMVLGLIVFLKVLGWLPAAVSKTEVKTFRSLEDARAALKIKRIYLPSYFPQYLSWPPDEILARRKPFTMVLMHFENEQRREIALAIRQSDSRDPAPLKTRIEPVSIRSGEDISLKGRQARLFMAICPVNRACNGVTWQDEGYTFTVIAKDSVEEVLKIAESMIAE